MKLSEVKKHLIAQLTMKAEITTIGPPYAVIKTEDALKLIAVVEAAKNLFPTFDHLKLYTHLVAELDEALRKLEDK